jgi:hypothetical protein
MPLSNKNRLPKDILAKAIERYNEMGWRQNDFIEVIEAARKIPLAIVGGQVQYVFPGATCELYWLSYDPKGRKPEEEWVAFCNRTADECLEKFKTLIETVDIDKNAIDSFEIIKEKKESGVNISDFRLFIIYFDDTIIPFTKKN